MYDSLRCVVYTIYVIFIYLFFLFVLAVIVIVAVSADTYKHTHSLTYSHAHHIRTQLFSLWAHVTAYERI